MVAEKLSGSFDHVSMWAFHQAFCGADDETPIGVIIARARRIVHLGTPPQIKVYTNFSDEMKATAKDVLILGGAYGNDLERKAAIHIPSITRRVVQKAVRRYGITAPRWRVVEAYFRPA